MPHRLDQREAWQSKKWYGGSTPMAGKMDTLLRDIYQEFGWKTRIIAPLVGRYVYASLKKEEQRLADGFTYEPQSFYEKNPQALALEKADPASLDSVGPNVGWVTCECFPVLGNKESEPKGPGFELPPQGASMVFPSCDRLLE